MSAARGGAASPALRLGAGATGTFTHQYIWQMKVGILANDRAWLSANAIQAGSKWTRDELDAVVTATAASVTPQEIFLLEYLPDNGLVAFRHRRNLSHDPKTGNVHANRGSKIPHQMWKVQRINDDFVALVTNTGKYLSADAAGVVSATATTIGENEHFRIVISPGFGDSPSDIADKTASSLNVAPGTNHLTFNVAMLCDHKDFLSVAEDGTRVHAESHAEGKINVLKLEVVDDDRFTLRAGDGRYIASGAATDEVVHVVDKVTKEATWQLQLLVDDRIGLHSIHRKFMVAEPSGKVTCDRMTATDWAAFKIVAGDWQGLQPAHVVDDMCVRLVVLTDHHFKEDEA